MTSPFPHITLRPAPTFKTLERYWHDPSFRDEIAAERATEQAKLNATIRGNQERFWERQRVRREVNEALETLAMEGLS